MPDDSFAARLRQIRLRANLSQQALAERIASTRTYVNDLESGRRANPGLALIQSLCSALSCTPSDLIPPT